MHYSEFRTMSSYFGSTHTMTLADDSRIGFLRKTGFSIFWFLFLITLSYISFQLRNFTDSLLVYLPTAFSIVLVHRYGYAMLPVIYLNAIISLFIWRAQGPWYRLVIIATHEPLVAYASRFFYKMPTWPYTGRLASTQRFLRLVFLGMLIPSLLNCIYTYNYTFVNGDWQMVALLWLSDIITILSLSLPLLYFFVPEFREAFRLDDAFAQSRTEGKKPWIEFWIVVVGFVALSFFIPFGQYWFVYGIIAAIFATRHGFEAVLLVNASIFLINYLLPLVETSSLPISGTGSTQLINVHLGNATMLFVSSLVGCVVSELKVTQQDLERQKEEIEKTNGQLNQTNQELDRFVYSVSHDLSAPLKSIQGLIKVARMETPTMPYLDMMEKSASRLNDFINEVLDYAKTSRKEISRSEVHLPQLVQELKERFAFNAESEISFTALSHPVLHTDATLLKVALGNLLSNAVKFQKKFEGHQPLVEIRTNQTNQEVLIEVTDNGEGIPPEHQEKIFDMFYRATSNSPGSGLGLYIAREAVHKLGGRIAVRSEYGEGSTFTVILPVN